MRRWTRLAVTRARRAVAVRALPGLTVGLALGAALPPAAQAAGNLLLMEAPPSQTAWSAGLSVWRLPQDPGARRHDTVVLPALDWQHPNGLFVSTDAGVGWNLSSVPTVQAGLRLWPQFGRSRKDAPPGLEPIGLRIQPEAFANVQLGSVLLLQGGLLVGAGRDRDGVQLELGATSGIPVGDDLIGIGLSATWANKAFRNDYFGVSEAEGRASGLPAIAFDGGWLDASLTLSAEHRFGSHWRLSGQWVLARLSGSTARSPLVRSRRQELGSLTLWRSF